MKGANMCFTTLSIYRGRIRNDIGLNATARKLEVGSDKEITNTHHTTTLRGSHGTHFVRSLDTLYHVISRVYCIRHCSPEHPQKHMVRNELFVVKNRRYPFLFLTVDDKNCSILHRLYSQLPRISQELAHGLHNEPGVNVHRSHIYSTHDLFVWLLNVNINTTYFSAYVQYLL